MILYSVVYFAYIQFTSCVAAACHCLCFKHLERMPCWWHPAYLCLSSKVVEIHNKIIPRQWQIFLLWRWSCNSWIARRIDQICVSVLAALQEIRVGVHCFALLGSDVAVFCLHWWQITSQKMWFEIFVFRLLGLWNPDVQSANVAEPRRKTT